MSIQRPSCFFNLCSSCSSRSNKRRRDCLLPPPRGRLCCRAGLTAPPYSHRWPSHPSTHPHLLLFSGDGRRTSKPSYSRTPLRVGNNCRVFPASEAPPSSTSVVLLARRGQCGQRPTSIGRVLYVERLTVGSTAAAGSTATAQFFCDLPSKSLCQACWAANLSRRGELHSAGRENGLSVMRNGLYIFKTHQTGN